MRPNDDNLLEWIRLGSQSENDKAFKIIYQNYFKVIEKFVMTNNGVAKDAEDIFQDALIVLFHQVKSNDLILNCSLQTYLYSICRNLWLKKLRKSGKITELTDVIKQHITINENQLETLIVTEQNQLVSDLLDQIGGDCKKVLLYFYFEKKKMTEIAEKMNLANEQVAKNKKFNCLKKLKSLVKASTFYQDQLKNIK